MSGPSRPLRATYRLQLSPDFGLRRGARSSCRTCATWASRHLYLSPSLQARERLDARLRRRRPDAVSRRARRRGGAARAGGRGAAADPRHRPQPHGHRRREPLVGRRARRRSSTSTRRPDCYRRFFDIDDLAAVRQEDPEVFELTHARCSSWSRDGVVDGAARRPPRRPRRPGRLPAAAARRRRAEHVWVEKILAPRRAAARLAGRRARSATSSSTTRRPLFVDPGAEDALTALLDGADRRRPRLREVALEAQLEQATTTFAREVEWLRALAPRSTPTRSPTRSPRCPSTAPTSSRRRGRVDDADRARRWPRHAGRAARRARCSTSAARRVRHPLPADLAAGHRQGRRGHRLLPLPPAARAQRGRRRPGALRHRRSTSSTRPTPSAARRFPAACSSPRPTTPSARADVRARIGALTGCRELRDAVLRWRDVARRCVAGGAPTPTTASSSCRRCSAPSRSSRRAARRLPREGAARGQAAHELGRPDPDYEGRVQALGARRCSPTTTSALEFDAARHARGRRRPPRRARPARCSS